MNRRSMKRIFDWIWIACVAAACGGTACSRGEADEEAVVPTEDGEELSDKPLVIRANIEGLLESRATVAPGRLRGEKWCLSLPLNEYGGAPDSKGMHQDYLIADFTKGYGEFTWHAKEDIDTKVPYELTWNKIMNKGDNHEIVMSLDNAPVYWDNMQIGDRRLGVGLYHDVNIGWYPDGIDYMNVTYLMPFYTEEEAKMFHPDDWERFRWKTTADGKELFDRDRYRAQLEPENGTISPNDLLAGYWYRYNGTDVRDKTLYIDISLKHIMSRVHVEISASDIPDIGQRKVKVWIDNLASKCYGIIRAWHAEMVNGVWQHKYPSAIIYPFRLAVRPYNGEWREGWNLLRNTTSSGDDYDYNYQNYPHDGRDETIYSNTLYLLGETDNDAKLLQVTDETGKVIAYRTHYLIMPPQSTNSGTDLAPRLHLEIDGTHYSCSLPPVITTAGTEQSSLDFVEFKENQDITLKVNVSDAPPKIELSAQVKNWVDKGTWVLETKRGGIYEEDDLKKAVQAFNKYVAATSNEKLKHAVERYGYFKAVSGKDIFTFVFFTDLPKEGSLSETYPAEAINETGTDLFDVEMNGHTIYGCIGAAEVGQDPEGKEDLMKKMKGGN